MTLDNNTTIWTVSLKYWRLPSVAFLQPFAHQTVPNVTVISNTVSCILPVLSPVHSIQLNPNYLSVFPPLSYVPLYTLPSLTLLPDCQCLYSVPALPSYLALILALCVLTLCLFSSPCVLNVCFLSQICRLDYRHCTFATLSVCLPLCQYNNVNSISLPAYMEESARKWP